MSDQERRRELAQQAIIEEQQREIAELREALAPVLLILVEPESGKCWDTTVMLLKHIGNGRVSQKRKGQIERLASVYRAHLAELPY